jgi:hypothetical protein
MGARHARPANGHALRARGRSVRPSRIARSSARHAQRTCQSRTRVTAAGTAPGAVASGACRIKGDVGAGYVGTECTRHAPPSLRGDGATASMLACNLSAVLRPSPAATHPTLPIRFDMGVASATPPTALCHDHAREATRSPTRAWHAGDQPAAPLEHATHYFVGSAGPAAPVGSPKH